MLLSPYQEFDEQTLTNYTDTTLFGTPIQSLARVAELLGFEVELSMGTRFRQLRQRLPGLVLVNAGMLFSERPTVTGHYLVVKEVRREDGETVVVNDPDPEYGGPDKGISKDLFLRAWQAKHAWLLSVRGRKDESTEG
jgi:ABC-type bacteriocin/lantibiotic exporter with double-glycine peptidase domain